MQAFLERIGGRLVDVCEETGKALALFLETLASCRGALFRKRSHVLTQMARVGPESLPIAALMALFTGMVLALHSGFALQAYSSEEMLATIVSLSMVKEMGPVLTGMLVAGRIGAAFAAEIGTMRVNDEIDALETLGISPVRYLSAPRLIACMAMVPALTVFTGVLGMLGGCAVASGYFDIPARSYFERVYHSITIQDLNEGMVKALVFGILVATISVHRGLQTSGGARGVGKAITQCVVQCFVSIFVSNYFVTRLFATAT